MRRRWRRRTGGLLLPSGCGAFGQVHLAALGRLGLAGRVLGFDPGHGVRAAWPAAAVPGAETRREVPVAGSAAVAEVDIAAEELVVRRGSHAAAAHGAWHPRHGPREAPAVSAADPVGGLAVAQLAAFLGAMATRRPTGPDLAEGGVRPLRILDAARRSAQEGRVVEIPACG